MLRKAASDPIDRSACSWATACSAPFNHHHSCSTSRSKARNSSSVSGMKHHLFTAMSKSCSLFVLILIHPPDAARKLRERSPRFARQVASSESGDRLGGAVVYRKGE